MKRSINMKKYALTFSILAILFTGGGLFASLKQEAVHVNTESEAAAFIPRASSHPEKDLIMGIVYHNLARVNPGRYISRAKVHLQREWKSTSSPLALGYLGSVITLEGSVYSKQGNVVKASAKVEEGKKLIDRAVSMAPGDLFLRFLRIGNAIGVSEASPFKRYDVAKRDLDYLSAKLDQADDLTRSLYYMYRGKVAMAQNRINDALVGFERSIRNAPRSRYAAESKKMIRILEE
jgi:tetratricopeptide (TPR) repeat protein